MRTALIGAIKSTQVAMHALRRAGVGPHMLVTLPSAQRGRHSDYVDLEPEAARLGIEVIHSSDGNDEKTLGYLRALAPDYLFVIGWSRLCRRPLLELPAHGAIGSHPAPLPRMRGRAVIPWTILSEQSESGTSLFWMDEGVDSGPILCQRRFDVASDETAAGLMGRHLNNLDGMLDEVLPLLNNRTAPRRPQNAADATYCAPRVPEDGLIDWTRPAESIWRLIRAVGRPYPGAYTLLGEEPLLIWDAAPHPTHGRYIGLPGQVQDFSGEHAIVMCGDNSCLTLREVQLGQGPVCPPKALCRRHTRFTAAPHHRRPVA